MRIGLFGGSFNPPHRGHLYASELALRQLKLDFVWWLVSPQNPLKRVEGMASFAARIAAAQGFVRNRHILVSDLEVQMNTRFTIDTIRAVRRRFPQIRFVWLMGSDNLVQLPRWRQWQRIFTLMPIAVVARPGSTKSARRSVAARRFAFAYAPPSRGFAALSPPAWTILDGRRDPTSATVIRSSAADAPVATDLEKSLTDRLSAATVGELAPLNARIDLQPYDGEWPRQYGELEKIIRNTIGPAALQIEHVGSTAVPGLSAKPIIDIVLAVSNSADEQSYVPQLERAGFILRIREPDWFEHRMFKSARFAANIHVFSYGCEEIARMVRFRDHLLQSVDDRRLYELTKQELAARSWKYVQQYADAKSDVIRRILSRISLAPSN